MKLISHRGNINGRVPEKENHPDYIHTALSVGFDVEVDIWVKGDIIYLGHDSPLYEVGLDYLSDRKDVLWLHCKNIEAIEYMFNTDLHYFWHNTDTLTITSKGYLWAYPGRQPIKNSIAVMPEHSLLYRRIEEDLSVCIGICSDEIEKYKYRKI